MSTCRWRSHLGYALPKCGCIMCPGVSRFPSAVRPAEACGKTLATLSHTLTFLGRSPPPPVPPVLVCEISTLTLFLDVDGCETPDQSFNFSKFPNLQEVGHGFRVGLMRGYLVWIPEALSTLRPTTLHVYPPSDSTLVIYIVSPNRSNP